MSIGESLPAEWQPTCDDIDYGRRLGLSEQDIDGMLEDMKLWAGANANRQIARKADWHLAFKGWLRREAKKKGIRFNGHQNGTASQRAFDLAREARLRERR
ncbi:MAG: hypothetical protein KGL39_06180 [Patescibacteria group bacterium]|nr:hypothetical protein [Patescibacteria group bacterium]